MKRTVRVFCAAFAAALSLSLISGCKPGDATESGTSGSETKKNVTLTLASWEVNALKAPWMAKFTEKHPEIKVELAEEGKWLGTEDLAKLAAANKMPDIINVENIYTPVKNNWLMDISSYYQNDPESSFMSCPATSFSMASRSTSPCWRISTFRSPAMTGPSTIS